MLIQPKCRRRKQRGMESTFSRAQMLGGIMTTVLVTGGAGMIGSNLVDALVGLGWDVWVVDNLWRGKLQNLMPPNRFSPWLESKFLNLDLRKPGALDEFAERFD